MLDFLNDIVSDDLQRRNRYDGGGRGGRGGRDGGRQGWGDGGKVELPSQLDDHQRKKFLKEIKGEANTDVHLVSNVFVTGLKVVVTHLPYPRQYKVNDVTLKTASQQTYVHQYAIRPYKFWTNPLLVSKCDHRRRMLVAYTHLNMGVLQVTQKFELP